MAIVYVDDSASGTNAGTSWTNAFTSITSADGAGSGAGDEVRVASGHSESFGATTLSWSGGTKANPIKIVSTNTSDDTYSAGASLSSNGSFVFLGHFRMYGVNLTTTGSGDLTLCSSSGSNTDHQEYSGGTITTVDRLLMGNKDGAIVRLHRMAFSRSGASSEGLELGTSGDGSRIEFFGCTFTKGSGIDQLMELVGAWGTRVLFEGCDVSDFGTILNNVPTTTVDVLLRGCEVASGATLVNGTLTVDCSVRLEACSNGTETTSVLGVSELEGFENLYGTVKSTTAKTRSGGASDGDTGQHSWDMLCSANVLELVGPLVSPPLVAWAAKDVSKTYTIHVAHGAVGGGTDNHLQDDEMWVEWKLPSAATATARRYIERTNDVVAGSSPMSPRTAPSDVTSDSSSWTGSDVGTKDKFEITHTADIEGPVTANVFMSMSSGVVVTVDPKIVVT